ncbi:hypothetical protein FRC03_012571 [Tulasnella sp. 419]|nr:hypothetical protein FRC03_012571 [Tulasnella sp. 419]
MSLLKVKDMPPLPAEAFSYHTEHDTHYYDDGNIIFILEEKTLFRLYRGAICKKSEVMRDMLDIPQPPNPRGTPDSFRTLSMDDQEYIDGVPAIALSDTVEEFSSLLDVLFPPRVPLFSSAPAPSLEAVEGVLKLSNKYVIQEALTWAEDVLEMLFPTFTDSLPMNSTPLPLGDPNMAAKLIRLARCNDLPKYLPLAFYVLATHPYGADLQARQADLNLLSMDDQARVLAGRAALLQGTVEVVSRRGENGLCISKARCSNLINASTKCGFGRSMDALWLDPASWWQKLLADPLAALQDRYNTAWSYTFCATCEQKMKAGLEEDRKTIYRRLNEFFQL